MTVNEGSSSSTEDFVRECARDWKGRGARPRQDDDDATLVALDGDAFLAYRLNRRPTELEARLFWAEIDRPAP